MENRKATITVVGGGAAGYLTALALQRTHLFSDISIIESPFVPRIGVGEATVNEILPFLHTDLGICITEFMSVVQPTFKLGIRFEWGQPDGTYFNAPFDWANDSIGLLGSILEDGSINFWNDQSVLMSAQKLPIYNEDGELSSNLGRHKFAYHFDTSKFCQFLRSKVRERKIPITEADVTDTDCALESDPPRVEKLILSNGQQRTSDYFVDCSGFRSLLLNKALKVSFDSFERSLPTDTAITFNVPHTNSIKPYTTATTMDYGWAWNIPQRNSDHCGYVFSSAFCSNDDAEAEILRKFGNASIRSIVRFRSGIHTKCWHGNVIAIGNAFGFVEPLESTGLLMIITHIKSFASAFKAIHQEPAVKYIFNERIRRSWLRLRWFLACHFKFNRRFQTSFWNHCNQDVEVHGVQALIDLFMRSGPLTQLNEDTQRYLTESEHIPFYGLHGFDCIMLGLNVPYQRSFNAVDKAAWRVRRAAASERAEKALSATDALDALETMPHLLQHLIESEDSWVNERSKRASLVRGF